MCVETAQYEGRTIKCEKKVRGPSNMRKKIVTCDVRIAQYEDRTVKCDKKVKEPPNVTKELSYVMLEPHNVRMEPLNVRKKSKGTT